MDWNFYRPITKLREGNVFTHVCLSTGAGVSQHALRQGVVYLARTWQGGVCIPVCTCSGRGVDRGGGRDGLKVDRGVVHPRAHNRRQPPKRAVCIPLECILVKLVECKCVFP